MLNEITQIQKDKYFTIPLVISIENSQKYKSRKQESTCPGLDGNRKIRSCFTMGIKFQLCEMTKSYRNMCNIVPRINNTVKS